MTNQLCANMKLFIFTSAHTFLWQASTPLDSKETKFSPVHQTWPSPAVPFNSLQELLSQLISFKSLSHLPSTPSLWLYIFGKRQDCKPATALLTSAGRFWACRKRQASLPYHVARTQTLSPLLSAAPFHSSFIPSCGKAHLPAPSLYKSSRQEAGTKFMIYNHPSNPIGHFQGCFGLVGVIEREQIKYSLYPCRREKGEGT